jgi:Mg2+ and Co2+ transporter CorA
MNVFSWRMHMFPLITGFWFTQVVMQERHISYGVPIILGAVIIVAIIIAAWLLVRRHRPW